jgi:large subunit ribosomal protein L22
MDAFAKAKFIRMSPRKVRLVTNMIVGSTIDVARTQLNFLNKAAALPVLKALNSAVANAVNNFKLDEKSLRIKAATADQGPTLKRWRARAMGRAAPIKKRTTHITIIVTDGKAAASVLDNAAKEEAKAKGAKDVKKETIKPEAKAGIKAVEPKKKTSASVADKPAKKNVKSASATDKSASAPDKKETAK